jgi:hypothetical protein
MRAGTLLCPSLLSEIHQEVGHVASVLGTFPHLCYVPRSLAKFRLELEQCVYKYLARLKDFSFFNPTIYLGIQMRCAPTDVLLLCPKLIAKWAMSSFFPKLIKRWAMSFLLSQIPSHTLPWPSLPPSFGLDSKLRGYKYSTPLEYGSSFDLPTHLGIQKQGLNN